LTSTASHPAVSEISTITSPELTSLEGNGRLPQGSPKQIKGYLKAGFRKNNKKGRAKGMTIIATDMPEKDEIEK
jgi:hypothetical protein